MKVILKSSLDNSTIGAVPVFSSVHYLSVGGRSFFLPLSVFVIVFYWTLGIFFYVNNRY